MEISQSQPSISRWRRLVTLRKDDDPASVTPERAYELLAEKRAKGPAKRPARRTARKAAARR